MCPRSRTCSRHSRRPREEGVVAPPWPASSIGSPTTCWRLRANSDLAPTAQGDTDRKSHVPVLVELLPASVRPVRDAGVGLSGVSPLCGRPRAVLGQQANPVGNGSAQSSTAWHVSVWSSTSRLRRSRRSRRGFRGASTRESTQSPGGDSSPASPGRRTPSRPHQHRRSRCLCTRMGQPRRIRRYLGLAKPRLRPAVVRPASRNTHPAALRAHHKIYFLECWPVSS